jgi:hypothetical protein
VVQALYQAYLHRPADPFGLNASVMALRNGATVEQLKAVLLSSPEYFMLHGSTNPGFLEALYLDVMHRPIDPGGEAGWLQQLAMGASRQQVALAIVQSPEADTVLVQGWYVQYLHRPADQPGLSASVNALQAGFTDQQIIANLLGSPEYFNDLVL